LMSLNVPYRIEVAEGFQRTDHMDSPYWIASGHVKTPCSSVFLTTIDGSQRQEVLEEDKSAINRHVCFSPDGKRMFCNDGQLYSRDLATGEVRVLSGIPHDPPYDSVSTWECSPDGRTLLLIQSTKIDWERSYMTERSFRLCRVNTDGTDFRVL